MSDENFLVKFLRRERLADSTFGFTFEKPFNFLPGQYVTIFLDTDSRDFTIASSPLEKDFTIVTKSGISKFKQTLFNLTIGSKIQIKHPAGGFTLHEFKSPKVFLAGGIGVTPFYSMITTVSKNNLSIPITLFVSFSKKSDIIFYDELSKIADENIKIIFTLSQDVWNGETGRITEELIRKYVPNLQEPECLIAGGEEMTYDTEELLLQMGIENSRIRLDIFTGY